MTTGLALNNLGSWGFHPIAINHRMRGKLRDGRWKSPWSTRVFFKDQETTRTPGTYRSQMRVLDLGLEVLLVVSCHGGAGSWTPVSEEAVKALNRWAISQVLAASTFFIDLSQMFKELHSWLTAKQGVERESPGSGSDSCGCQRFLEQWRTQSQQCSGDL